jgi:hypothetical protein
LDEYKSKMKNWSFFLLLCVSISWMPSVLRAQCPAPLPLPENMDFVGDVRAIAHKGDTIYYGGDFNLTQSASSVPSFGIPVDVVHGQRILPYPQVAFGTVYHVVSDGDGGYYIAGSFTSVGGLTRNRVARITKFGKVDPDFVVNVDNTVHQLAFDGTRLFLGGKFDNVNSTPRSRIAAVDPNDGTLLSWYPTGGANDDVTVLALSTNGLNLYVGGDFTFIGGSPRNRLAQLDAGDASLKVWNPGAGGSITSINAIVPTSDDNIVFLGGEFTFIGGESRQSIAAVNSVTGAALTWNPGADGAVNCIALSPDENTIYIGGVFNVAGGSARDHAAAIDWTSATATAWDPQVAGGGMKFVPSSFPMTAKERF